MVFGVKLNVLRGASLNFEIIFFFLNLCTDYDSFLVLEMLIGRKKRNFMA